MYLVSLDGLWRSIPPPPEVRYFFFFWVFSLKLGKLFTFKRKIKKKIVERMKNYEKNMPFDVHFTGCPII